MTKPTLPLMKRTFAKSLVVKAVALCVISSVPMVAFPQGLGAQRYENPILHEDYSDPDVCKVGEDYYMTSSSFNHFPGLQILHSRDLVHWTLIGAALSDYPGPLWDGPAEDWRMKVHHGEGVWAPSIRYHDGWFYIFCGDPDRGVFMVRTQDPAGRWSDPVWVMKGKGIIDTCPLWDDDGRVYLSHGCAGSRAGVKSVIFVAELSSDATSVLTPSRIVYDGHLTDPTIEGTKFHVRDGKYYIFCPAGGVATGWQTVLRSESPWGPYEARKLLRWKEGTVNGPHQGAWVEGEVSGEDYFIHFQDKDAYGRIVHMQPLRWDEDGWPVFGDGGYPVKGAPMPSWAGGAGKSTFKYDPAGVPCDEGAYLPYGLPLQWQYPAVPSPYWHFHDGKTLRLYSVQQSPSWRNLSDSPNLLLRKFSGESFTVTAKMTLYPNPSLSPKGEEGGFVVMGEDYKSLVIVDSPDGGVQLQLIGCSRSFDGTGEERQLICKLDSGQKVPVDDRGFSGNVPRVVYKDYSATSVWVRLTVSPSPREGNVPDAICQLHYSLDGRKFRQAGDPFRAVPGKWVGAKWGFYCLRRSPKNDSGWLEVTQLEIK